MHTQTGVDLVNPDVLKEMKGITSRLMDLKLSGPGSMHCAAAWGDVYRCYNDPDRPTGPPVVKALESFEGKDDAELDSLLIALNAIIGLPAMAVMVGDLQSNIAIRVDQLHKDELAKREAFWSQWVNRISESFGFAAHLSNALIATDKREKVGIYC